jgi:hypothetical protein
MTNQPFPPPTPPSSGPDDLSNRLRSMVDRTSPAVTADEAQFTTVVTPLPRGGVTSSPIWRVAAVGLGALAVAGSATSYAVGRSAGKRAADKRVTVVPGNPTAPKAASSSEATVPVAVPVSTRGGVAYPAPPATIAAAVAPGYDPSGKQIAPEDAYGPAPEKLFDRTVGTTTMHVYRQTQVFGYGYDESSVPPGVWFPPKQCRPTGQITAYVATANFTGQTSGQEYSNPTVPIAGYGGQVVGHPKLEFIALVPVQVPAGAKTVRLIGANDAVVDEMVPNQGWAVLVNPDGLSAVRGFDLPVGPDRGASAIEVEFEDGRKVKAVQDGMPGSPSAAKECQPPPPPPPTLLPDYTALTGAGLDDVKTALTEAFAANDTTRTTVTDRVQNHDKFPAGWFEKLAEARAFYNITNAGIDLSTAGSKGDRAVAVFSITGTPLENQWQVVELVKGSDGKWLLTSQSYCRIAGLANPCPTELYDPNTDQGLQPVDYGNGGGGYPEGPVFATTAAPQRSIPVPQTAPASTVPPTAPPTTTIVKQ